MVIGRVGGYRNGGVVIGRVGGYRNKCMVIVKGRWL